MHVVCLHANPTLYFFFLNRTKIGETNREEKGREGREREREGVGSGGYEGGGCCRSKRRKRKKEKKGKVHKMNLSLSCSVHLCE